MADIRINQLPAEASPVATDVLPIDGATTRKTTIQAAVTIGRPTASQAEAEAGIDAFKAMTPLTTKQSISSEVGVTLQQYSANLATLAGVNPGAAGLEILGDALQADVRDYLDVGPYVADRTALKALDTTKDTVAYLKEAGREGIFQWKTGDYSSLIALDTLEGIYVKATAIAATAGAWVRIYDNELYLTWFGADKTGGADSSPALAVAQSLIPKGGIIRGRPGDVYYLADPPVLARGVRLLGETNPNKDRDQLPAIALYPTTLIIPSSKTLSLDGAEVSNWLIWRQGLVTPTYPVISDAEALAIIAAYAGTAITFVGDDSVADNNLILGFNKAIYASGVFRPKIFNNHIDCTNGVEATDVRDCGESYGVMSNRCWPYLIGSQPYSWVVNRRSGKAFYFHDTCDGLIAEGNFAYGYTTSLHLDDVYAMRVSIWADNIGFGDPVNAAGTIGIYTTGNCNKCQITAHVDAHDKGYHLAHNVGQVAVVGTCGIAVTTQVTLDASSSGTIDLMVSGSCVTPVVAQTGVGKWVGKIEANSAASSGSLVTFNSADRANLSQLKLYQIGTTLTDTLSSGTAAAPSIQPNPSIQSGMFLNGDPVAFSLKGALVAQFTAGANAVNYPSFLAQSTGNRVLMQAAGSDANIDLQLVPKGGGVFFSASHFFPTSDNVFSLGANGVRWSAVWAANGTIQTSDPSQKMDISLIDPELAMLIIQLIDPITFKWKDGGKAVEMVEREVEEPVTETVVETIYDVEVVDGVAVRTSKEIHSERPVVKTVEVIDGETGEPVLVKRDAIIRGGVVISPETMVPMTHDVPVTHNVKKLVPTLVERPGSRVHWGFNAKQVQVAFEIVERDFGGFVIADDGSLALRPDQMIPILWAALRGIMAGLPTPEAHDKADHLIGA